jgi:hypothetical protein
VRKYRFYIAWLQDSDGGCGDETNIFQSEDLIPEYNNGNGHVSCTEIEANTLEQAYDKGYRWAFFENFTAKDTVTVCEMVAEDTD